MPETAPDTTPMPGAEHRAVVSWEGASEPITLTLYTPNGEATTVRLAPTRALELAQALIRPSIQSIKHSQWGPGWSG